jgi:hypothetical protein
MPNERRFEVKNGILHHGSGPLLLVGFLLAAAVLLSFVTGTGSAADAKAKKKVLEQKKAFAVYQKKCLSCHDSVADPEKPGRTRDDWHVVINVMHGYGLDITHEEDEAINDLLYELRKGLEKDAG